MSPLHNPPDVHLPAGILTQVQSVTFKGSTLTTPARVAARFTNLQCFIRFQPFQSDIPGTSDGCPWLPGILLPGVAGAFEGRVPLL